MNYVDIALINSEDRDYFEGVGGLIIASGTNGEMSPENTATAILCAYRSIDPLISDAVEQARLDKVDAPVDSIYSVAADLVTQSISGVTANQAEEYISEGYGDTYEFEGGYCTGRGPRPY